MVEPTIHSLQTNIFPSLQLNHLHSYTQPFLTQMWIHMKMPQATSTDIGNSLQAVQTLQKKNNSLKVEIDGHEVRITELCNRASAIVDEGHPQGDKIKQAVNELQDMWQQLLDAMKERKAKLIDSEKAQEVSRVIAPSPPPPPFPDVWHTFSLSQLTHYASQMWYVLVDYPVGEWCHGLLHDGISPTFTSCGIIDNHVLHI